MPMEGRGKIVEGLAQEEEWSSMSKKKTSSLDRL